jgi:hypothetical protein
LINEISQIQRNKDCMIFLIRNLKMSNSQKLRVEGHLAGVWDGKMLTKGYTISVR